MPRRLNYTGRVKIPLDRVKIEVKGEGSELRFDAAFALDGMKLPSDARVFVEAYRGASTSWKRFEFGRVGLLQPPADRGLTEFVRPDGLLFRVKVTGSGEAGGRLLAQADAVRPGAGEEGQARSLITVRPDETLGDELWRLSLEGDLPELLVNDRVGSWREFVSGPIFRALVTPTIVRQVLTHVLVVRGYTGDEEGEEQWFQWWYEFASRLPNVSELDLESEDPDRRGDWVEEAVGAFCRSNAFLAKYLDQSEDRP